MCKKCDELHQREQDITLELQQSMTEQQYALWMLLFETIKNITSTYVKNHW
mgnify:CR=1 FL=1